MRELIGFEITKLLRKPLVWVSLGGMLLLMFLMAYNWVAPGYLGVQEENNGEWVVWEGFDGIARSKEIAGRFAGPLTTEKVQEIIDTFAFSREILESRGLDPDRQSYYFHNSTYDTLDDFTKMDGTYNGNTVEDVYGDVAQDLVMGYCDGWEGTVYSLIFCFMSWCCIVIIILTPVFSEEYTKHMDALILTGRRGRFHCPAAKVIAAYAVTMAGSLILLGFFVVILVVVHGTTGFDTSAQIGTLEMFELVPYTITWGQIFAFGCMMWLGATVVVISLSLVVSALAKSSFSALVIAFTLFAVPLFIPWSIFPEPFPLVGMFMPINQMKIYEIYRFVRFDFGGFQLNVMWLSLPIALIATVTGVLWSQRAFAKHQVM